MRTWTGWPLLVPALIVISAGCGTVETQMTVEQLTNARVAVEAAERADAKKLSSENLRHAQDALAIANDAYAGKEVERAFAFAKRATIYARVAKAQSEQKQAEDKFLASQTQLEALRKQSEAEMAALPGAFESVTGTAGAAVAEASAGTPAAAAPAPAPTPAPTAAPTPGPTTPAAITTPVPGSEGKPQ
jgi:hypothetical protein